MSAYMVDREHIDALVELAVYGPAARPGGAYPGGGWRCSGTGLTWCRRDPVAIRQMAWDDVKRHTREARSDTADAIGLMLITENLASIHHRYPDTVDGGDIPGPSDCSWFDRYTFTHPRVVPTAVEGLKLIDCYAYQACEHPSWPLSEAHSFCDALRSRLIGELPGYDAAPWGWPPTQRAATAVEARS